MSVTVVEEPSTSGTADFVSLKLRPELLRALEAANYTTPTPIQAAVIPAILSGEDVLAAAQTGTGKTAGFTLPVLQRLMETSPVSGKPGKAGSRRPIRVLTLTPTRELAAQVEESVQRYGRFLPVTSTTVFGGVGMSPQVRALARGVDILVATPGRLLDHMRQNSVDLSRVEILILDEADRMLDMGFVRDIQRILAFLPHVSQRLLFSATFSPEIKSLAAEMLNDPRHIEVARPNAESALVAQHMYAVRTEQKRSLLLHLLMQDHRQQALVFTRTKHGADRLVKHLEQDGVTSVAIHGNRSQTQRTKALSDFKTGQVRILVATDIAARGLDIPLLPLVVNYEIPNVPEDYVHRIGRTGRAGSEGVAVSLVSPDERKFIAAVERLTGNALQRLRVEGLTEAESRQEAKPVEAPVRSESRPAQKTARTSPTSKRPGNRPPTVLGGKSSGAATNPFTARPARTAASHKPRHKRKPRTTPGA
ncbi:MAG: DEAD/DEAH box helicase [Armatimonadaceae bacterium]